MSHDHGHHHPAPSQRRALAISIGANTTLLVAQVVVALAIGSLALLADSIHNASDVVALVIALIGQSLALRPASARRTYGLARAEILAALVNGAVLLALTGWVVVEAIGRFDDPAELKAAPLAAIGLLGLAVNGASAWYLARSGGGSLNMRAAFWHLTSDALGSFGVIVAAGAVAFFQAAWVDPAVSILISLLILVGVWRLLKDTIDVLLETVPGGIDPDEVEPTSPANPASRPSTTSTSGRSIPSRLRSPRTSSSPMAPICTMPRRPPRPSRSSCVNDTASTTPPWKPSATPAPRPTTTPRRHTPEPDGTARRREWRTGVPG